MMFRDKQVENRENVINIVNENSFIWTNEFHNMLEIEMLCSNSIPELCSAYGRFVLSCKSYDDFYRLAKILFKVISREINNFEGIFIYYYNVLYYTKDISTERKINNSLFEFYKYNNKDVYEQLIEMTKIVLSKDKYKSNKYITLSTLFE